MERQQLIKWILVIVILLWGLNVVMVKYLVSLIPPLTLSSVRITIASLVLIPVAIWWEGRKRVSGRAWLLLLGAALCSICVHQIGLGYGLIWTPASTAALIIALNPLLTSLFAFFADREEMGARKLTGIAFGFAGVSLVVWGDDGGAGWTFRFGLGEALVMAATLGYAVGNLLVKRAARLLSPLVLTAYTHGMAAIMLWVVTLAVEGAVGFAYPAEAWWVILLSALGPTALATIGWNSGIKQLGAARTSIFMNGVPASSVLFAVLFLAESVTVFHVIGFVCIAGGISLGASRPERVLTAADDRKKAV